jgi:hypothetical protein
MIYILPTNQIMSIRYSFMFSKRGKSGNIVINLETGYGPIGSEANQFEKTESGFQTTFSPYDLSPLPTGEFDGNPGSPTVSSQCYATADHEDEAPENDEMNQGLDSRTEKTEEDSEDSSRFNYSSSFIIGMQKNLKRLKESVSFPHRARTKDIYTHDLFDALLTDLAEIKHSQDIRDKLELLLLNIVELEREEQYLKYADGPLCSNLKTNLYMAALSFKTWATSNNSSEAETEANLKEMNEAFDNLKKSADALTNRFENTSPASLMFRLRQLALGCKTVLWSMISWATRFGAAGAAVGAGVGAVIGATGGTVCASLVATPVIAPVGAATGAACGAGAGAATGAVLGAFGGSLFGIGYGCVRAIKGQNKITQDATHQLIKKMRSLTFIK